MTASSEALVLGIDAGATKTVGLLAGPAGVVARARGGGANLQIQGEAVVEQVLAGILEGVGGAPRVGALCAGMAGVDRPHDEAAVRRIVSRLGCRGPVRVVNDAVVALAAGSPTGTGVVILAGTGSIAYGRDAGGRTARAGGLGSLLADEGSGYWIGNLALRAVVRAADQRGPATALTPYVFETLAVASVDELVPLIYERRLPRSAVASLVRVVERARRDGDETAALIIDEAARELGLLGRAVARRLSFVEDFAVVLAGGVFEACPSLVGLVKEHLGVPAARVGHLEGEPAQGAVVLARQLLEER